MITEFIVTAGETRKRLDRFLVNREPEISRSGLQRLITRGRIRVNGQGAKPGQMVKPGDCITMDTPQPGELRINGEVVTLEILHEDEALLVVNKPAGVVVHPSSGNWSGTLTNALLAHLHTPQGADDQTNGTVHPGLVHRLDKQTSGVMVVSKTAEAHRALAAQFERHTVSRTYEALVWGVPPDEQGTIDLAIGRDRIEGKKVSSYTAYAQRAVTEYRVVRTFGNMATHVMLSPHTGRTHQLRAHLSALGCPILGDETYGNRKVCRIKEINIPRMMLHACILGFCHPISLIFQEFTVDPPPDMQLVFRALQCEVE